MPQSIEQSALPPNNTAVADHRAQIETSNPCMAIASSSADVQVNVSQLEYSQTHELIASQSARISHLQEQLDASKVEL